MFKKIGVATMALAGMLAFGAPRKADAAVRFGIGIGAPVYPVAPVYPYSPYYAPAYPYPGYVAPGYVAPGFGIGFGWGGGGGHFHGRDFGGHGRR